MPAQTFYCRAQSVSEVDHAQRLRVMSKEREAIPLKAGDDGFVYLFLGLGVLISLLLCVVLVMIYRLYRGGARSSVIQDNDEPRPRKEEDGEALLYKRLCGLMETEELFKNSQLNRDILAERLETNHVYLAKAVRKYAGGLTVGEFINEVRLRHSADLLTSNMNLSIDKVKKLSGFNSRTTFGRLFRERYGMSPTKYRMEAKEKKGKDSSCGT